MGAADASNPEEDVMAGSTDAAAQAAPQSLAAAPLISADSHIFEPGNLWLERTAKKFHDRVPKIISIKEGDTWEYGGGRTMAFAGFATAGDWKGRTSSYMR